MQSSWPALYVLCQLHTLCNCTYGQGPRSDWRPLRAHAGIAIKGASIQANMAECMEMKWPSSKKSDAGNGITRHVYVGIAKLARSPALNLVQSRSDRPKVLVRNERHSTLMEYRP